jgi:DNA-binding PadR family transcriptional regulator
VGVLSDAWLRKPIPTLVIRLTGEFEHIIVLALLRLEDRAYGVTVRQEIEFRIKREVSIGAVYATLDRLETKGYVKSYHGDPTPERG